MGRRSTLTLPSGYSGSADVIDDQHLASGAQFFQIGGTVTGHPGIGMDSARVNPEGPGRDILVLFRLRIDEKGKGRRIAYQHALSGM